LPYDDEYVFPDCSTRANSQRLFHPDKNKTLKYARESGKFANVISCDCGYYAEGYLSPEMASLFGGFPFTPDEEDYLTFSIPRWGNNPERVPFTAVADDYGHIVHGILLDPAKYNGTLVQAVSDIKSFQEVVDAFVKVTGKKARLQYLPSAESFETFNSKGLEDVRDMFRFLQIVSGRYYDGAETELETAKQLKASAFEAMGLADGHALTSIDDIFKKNFGQSS
jgi:hypothetical protein